MEEEERDYLPERSDEVNEVLGRAPNWVVQIGISIIFVIVLLILLAAALIGYNDIIQTQIVVTTKIPPAYLKAKSSGKLTDIFINQNQNVSKNEVLAVIENTADFNDILLVKKNISTFKPSLISLDSLKASFPPYLKLGDIQNSYGEFVSQYQNYILFYSLAPNQQESIALKNQFRELETQLKQQRIQLSFAQMDLELSKKAHERSEHLFNRNVISKAEFENSYRKYLSDSQTLEGLQAITSNTRLAISSNKNLLAKSDIDEKKFVNHYSDQLQKAYQNVINNLLEWEQNFTITSPMNGKVTVFDIWTKNQNVKSGETVFTVIPNNTNEIIGYASLPIRNSGKVKRGQRVIIKLDNYPFYEWGSLEGEIISISEVPKQGEQSVYALYIEIDNLKTSFGKEIKFKQEMTGTGEIVIEELTILQRLFYQIRKTFNSE